MKLEYAFLVCLITLVSRLLLPYLCSPKGSDPFKIDMKDNTSNYAASESINYLYGVDISLILLIYRMSPFIATTI